MAAVTDPSAIAFCNQSVRPLADKIAQMYNFIIAAGNDYTAKGLSGLIPNDTSSISDGSPNDGRTAITGADVTAIITLATSLKTSLEANSKQMLNQVLKVGVNINSTGQ